jgi:hypothetical protein
LFFTALIHDTSGRLVNLENHRRIIRKCLENRTESGSVEINTTEGDGG